MEEVERWRDVCGACLAEESDDVLAELGSALNAVSTAVVLEPTDILVLDNWRICHGRPQFFKQNRVRLEREGGASLQTSPPPSTRLRPAPGVGVLDPLLFFAAF